MLRYDDNLCHVAAIVRRLNSHYSGKSVDHVRTHMMLVAQQTFGGGALGYVSTGGIVLSAFPKPDHAETYIYASVADYRFSAEKPM